MYLAEHGLEGLVEFKWKNLETGRQVSLSNSQPSAASGKPLLLAVDW
jgi:hypothetical protein